MDILRLLIISNLPCTESKLKKVMETISSIKLNLMRELYKFNELDLEFEVIEELNIAERA